MLEAGNSYEMGASELQDPQEPPVPEEPTEPDEPSENNPAGHISGY